MMTLRGYKTYKCNCETCHVQHGDEKFFFNYVK